MGRAAGYRWDAIEFAEEMNWEKSMGIVDDLANTYMQSLEMKKQAELDNYEKTLESITGLFQELTSGVNEINKPGPKIATIKNNFVNLIIFVFL